MNRNTLATILIIDFDFDFDYRFLVPIMFPAKIPKHLIVPAVKF